MERDLIIESKLSNLKLVRDFLDKIFTESDLDRIFFNRVLLGLSEAVNNSILHGNRLKAEKNVFIKVSLDKDYLFVDVADEGIGFDFTKVFDPNATENRKKENGRGIFLIRHFAQEVNFSEEGRRVIIKYQLRK